MLISHFEGLSLFDEWRHRATTKPSFHRGRWPLLAIARALQRFNIACVSKFDNIPPQPLNSLLDTMEWDKAILVITAWAKKNFSFWAQLLARLHFARGDDPICSSYRGESRPSVKNRPQGTSVKNPPWLLPLEQWMPKQYRVKLDSSVAIRLTDWLFRYGNHQNIIVVWKHFRNWISNFVVKLV